MEVPTFLFNNKELNLLLEKRIISNIKSKSLSEGKQEEYFTVSEADYAKIFTHLNERVYEGQLNEKVGRSFIVRYVSVLFNLASRASTVSDRMAFVAATGALANVAPNEANRLIAMAR